MTQLGFQILNAGRSRPGRTSRSRSRPHAHDLRLPLGLAGRGTRDHGASRQRGLAEAPSRSM